MQIDCGTLRRALKNLVRLVPTILPMLEHLLFAWTLHRPRSRCA